MDGYYLSNGDTIQKRILLLLILVVLVPPPQVTVGQAQVPELPNFDPRVYYGLEYGAAGIVSVLMDVAELGTVENSLTEAIQAGLEAVWSGQLNESASWGKGPEDTLVYPGRKYGAVGIAEAFLKMYDLTGDYVWLERSIAAYEALRTQAINSSSLPHWPYSYALPKEENGVPITDIRYGAGGVIELTLSLYEHTQNSSYLEYASLIADWIASTTETTEVNGASYRIVPWFSFGETVPVFKYGYQVGMAGLAPLLYQLGELSQQNRFKDLAMELTNFILTTQRTDGAWEVDYTFDFQTTGMYEGVSGVLLGLVEMRELAGIVVDEAVSRGIEFLFDHLKLSTSESGFYKTRDREVILTDFTDGTLGVLWFLTSNKEFLTDDQERKLTTLIANLLSDNVFFADSAEGEMAFIHYFSSGSDYVDFSFGKGLAGFLHVMLSLQDDSAFRSLKLDYSKYIDATVRTLLTFQGADGLWVRQRSLGDSFDTYFVTIEGGTSRLLPLSTLPAVFGLLIPVNVYWKWRRSFRK